MKMKLSSVGFKDHFLVKYEVSKTHKLQQFKLFHSRCHISLKNIKITTLIQNLRHQHFKVALFHSLEDLNRNKTNCHKIQIIFKLKWLKIKTNGNKK